jgi:SnoaL-like protein
MDQLTAEKLAIRETLDNWVLWRDSGDWERFKAVWHPKGWMNATWFQGPFEKFIEVSAEGFNKGLTLIHHFYGGSGCEISGDRAIAQTKMTISQRGRVDGVLVDVLCTGRMFDFLQKYEGRWLVRRRQPIYEKDRMDPVDPTASIMLDRTLLESFPEGYRYLAYLQTRLGFPVKKGLPGLTGTSIEKLYREGNAWLSGSEEPGDPHWP